MKTRGLLRGVYVGKIVTINPCRILVRKPLRRRLILGLQMRWDYNIKMELREKGKWMERAEDPVNERLQY
jgi:hypothetical protein